MKKKKVLSLSTDIKSLSYLIENKGLENILFIDQVFSKEFNDNNNIIRIVKNENETKKTYDYCEKIFQIISKHLYNILNQLHEINFSERSWRIIYGKWLKEFIYIVHKNYYLINEALNNYEVSEIITIDNDYNLTTQDTLSFTKAQRDVDWNFSINSEIIKRFQISIKNIKIKSKSNFFNDTRNYKNNFIYEKLTNLFNSSSSTENTLIYCSSFSFLDEKKLEVKMGQFPKIWIEKKIHHRNYDPKIRKKISLINDTKDKFEHLLRELIPKCLPVFLVESFKSNLNKSQKIGLPKKPKKIFTCYSYAYDELFKIYLANQITYFDTKYYCGQHGANYFTSSYSEYLQEVIDCDRFLSWGYSDNNKILSTFNFKTYNKKKKIDPKGNLLVIFGSVGSSKSPLERNLVDINSIENTLKIFESKKLKNIPTLFRLHFSFKEHFNSYYYEKYFKKNKGNNKIDLGLSNLKDLQFKSRLNMFNSNSTGLLENLVLNIPTVCLFEEEHDYHGQKLKNIYSNLIKAKIIFFNKEKLIDHIFDIWNDIDHWWFNKDTQSLINEFNKKFNRKEQEDFSNLIKYLN